MILPKPASKALECRAGSSGNRVCERWSSASRVQASRNGLFARSAIACLAHVWSGTMPYRRARAAARLCPCIRSAIAPYTRMYPTTNWQNGMQTWMRFEPGRTYSVFCDGWPTNPRTSTRPHEKRRRDAMNRPAPWRCEVEARDRSGHTGMCLRCSGMLCRRTSIVANRIFQHRSKT